jgi:1-acyl-sn-glycerol-3-phosphate acyltransferase
MEVSTAESSTQAATPKRTSTLDLDLLELGKDLLSETERRQIQFVRSTFEPGRLDRTIRTLQRHVGSIWIDHATKNLRSVYGLDRLPVLDPKRSYICVANHRSFFDLYVITSFLVRRNLLPHRLLFPVRSKFFYDHPLGLAVNGLMSFFAMYPPVFRERSRAALNLATLDEVARILRRGGAFVGLHPEGQRNMNENPYDLMPAKFGVGRVIHGSNAIVLPVFINGMSNDLKSQVKSNYDGTGGAINLVFGKPIDFGELATAPGNQSTFRKISEHALEQVRKLGEEERAIRNA